MSEKYEEDLVKVSVDSYEFWLNHPVHKFSTWFQVGPQNELIGADPNYLMMDDKGDCFRRLLPQTPHPPCSRENPIPLPNLDPKGFKLIIRFVHTNIIESPNNVVDVSTLFEAFLCAKEIGYRVFEGKCLSLLLSKISYQNCIQFYARGVKLCHQELMEISMKFIKTNVKSVLKSTEFLETSEDDLCILLSVDDWFLPERSVFEAVKRWVMARVDASSAAVTELQAGNKGLRLAMGKTFHLIRFPLLTRRQFEDIWLNHEGLFEDSEMARVTRFIYNKRKRKQNCPTTIEGFITKPRQLIEVELDCSEPEDNSNGN